jgi:hypothetical protein
VYCTRCGRRNEESARFCTTCGHELELSPGIPAPVAPGPAVGESPLPGLKRTSVVLVVVLSFLTVAIYYPVWFLRRRSALNGLHARDKLNAGVFVVAIVLFSAGLVLLVMSGALEGFGEGLGSRDLLAVSKGLEGFAQFLNLVAAIALLIQCFKVRRILMEHVQARTGQPIALSAAATFFLQIFYLQHKINRILGAGGAGIR